MFPQHTLHILIAEDDKDDILFINLGFKKYAAFSKIDIVRDGEELLNFLSKLSPDQFPDVILTDLNMPRKSGYEAIVELNAHPLFSKIPLIVYSTTDNPVVVKKCLELGALGFILKPFDLQEYFSLPEQIVKLLDAASPTLR